MDEPDWQESDGGHRRHAEWQALLHDRDPLFTAEFLGMLADVDGDGPPAHPDSKVSGLTAVRDGDILSASLEESSITDYAAKNIDLRTRARETNPRLR